MPDSEGNPIVFPKCTPEEIKAHSEWFRKRLGLKEGQDFRDLVPPGGLMSTFIPSDR